MWEFFLELTKALPLAVALIIIFAFLALLNPDKAKIWASWIAYLLSKFVQRCEYYAIKWDIEGNINSFVEQMSTNTHTKFPKVKIKWAVQDGVEEVVWEEDKVIIVMRDREHKGRNFVSAAHIFTSGTLLGNSVFHISKKQKKSIDLYATKKLLEKTHSELVLQYMHDYFAPSVNADDAMKVLIGKYEQIEKIGAFFPILVYEVYCLGSKVHVGEVHKSDIIAEVANLIDFLVEFSNREVGSYGEFTFVGDYTRCAIRIVASGEVRRKGDTAGHVNGINELIDRSLENIYLIGSGKLDNRIFIKKVIDDVKSARPTISVANVYTYTSILRGLGNRTMKVGTCLVHLRNPDAVNYIVYRKGG